MVSVGIGLSSRSDRDRVPAAADGHAREVPVRWAAAFEVVMRILACLALAPLLAACTRPPAVPPSYERPFGESLFAPAEARVDGQETLPPDALTGSDRCGACHPEIHGQWQASLHRPAATDPFARFAMDRMAENYGVPSMRLCVGCHEPGALLAGRVDRGARPDPATRREGVSCLSCHLVEQTHESRAIGVVANAAYTLRLLDRKVLFPDADATTEALRTHAAALRRPFLSENRFCDACHRFYIPAELGGYPAGRLRLQSAETAGTPYADPAAPGFRSCVDCHMPRMAGTDPAAKDGKIHDHRALGSNVLVPTLEGDAAQAAATEAFRRAGAVDLEILPPRRDDGGGVIVPVELRNHRNGHDFPTGATDISEVWGELVLVDARGSEVFRSPGLDENRFLSDEAPSLNTLVYLPGGDLDALHDLLSQVDLKRHPRVRPGGTQTLEFKVRIPEGEVGPLVAKVVLRARHGNERWNRWVFNWQDVEVPVTDLAKVERPLGPIPPPAAETTTPPGFAPTPPKGMVFVPGGTYVIGADPKTDPDAQPDEWPPHPVTLQPFFLDRAPVTVQDWADAVARGVVPPPPETDEPPLRQHSWHGGRPPPGLGDHPVVLVGWEEARAYCASVGKRLPREAEWEAAARGRDGRRYAWGDTFDPAVCNTAEAGRRMTVPAGSQPGNASPFGALDLGCNVAELVEDPYQAYPRVRQPDNRESWSDNFTATALLSRGASYEGSAWRARASNRTHDEPLRKLIGFRCAVDVPPEAP